MSTKKSPNWRISLRVYDKVVFYKLSDDKRTFSFDLQYPKNLAFEASMTSKEETPFFSKTTSDEGVKSTYTFLITAVRTVSQVLKAIGCPEIDTSDLASSFGKPVFEDLGQSYLYPQQYEYMKAVKRVFSGIVSTETGSGKTTMITYICMMSQIRKKNILICAPTYSVVEEICSRLARYRIKASMECDPSSTVWVVNPVGLMARNNKEEFKGWMSEVDMLIVDEADGVTNSLEELIIDFLPNCRYFYGFSATADREEGKRFDHITSLNSFNDTAARLLIFFGPMIVYHAPTKKIRLVVTPLRTGNYRNFWSFDKCVKHVTHSSVFPLYIKTCIEDNNKFGKSTILIPFTNRDQVLHLLSSPILFPYSIAMWTASGIRFNKSTEEVGAGLERVKDLVNNHKVDVLMTSQVGFKGIDLVQLKSVLFFTGSSYGVVIQILGRIFRYKGPELPTVYFLQNMSDNPLYNKAQRTRFGYISQNDHVTDRLYLPYNGR